MITAFAATAGWYRYRRHRAIRVPAGAYTN
jgi:hypothetical protein